VSCLSPSPAYGIQSQISPVISERSANV
jgi:hypothetical protein